MPLKLPLVWIAKYHSHFSEYNIRKLPRASYAHP